MHLTMDDNTAKVFGAVVVGATFVLLAWVLAGCPWPRGRDD